MPTPTTPVRLFYIDDSGAAHTGWIVYAWLECTATTWNTGLRAWLEFRKDIYARYAIPPSYELHASVFAGGHGNPSTNPNWNRAKRLRGDVMRQALHRIATIDGLRIGTVYRHTRATRHAYAVQRADTYQALIQQLDGRLSVDGELGLVFMDGDGTDTTYDTAHRNLKLGDRHLIEDPLYRRAHRSQWIQMADLVAWSTYQHLHRAANRRYAWTWYDTYLRPRDVNGGPVEL